LNAIGAPKLLTRFFYAAKHVQICEKVPSSTLGGQRTKRRHVLNEEKQKETGARHARFTKPMMRIVT
jgi:hypothetical protein